MKNVSLRHCLRRLCLPALLLVAPPGLAQELAATLHWSQVATLSTPVSGVVREVGAVVGQRVGKGQVLVRLDDRGFEAAQASARAALAESHEDFAEAGRELERAEALYERTVLSDHDLQLAKIAKTRAEARYQGARAELTRAQLELEYSVLKAPFAGVVLDCPAYVGQTVVNRLNVTPLVMLAATDTLLARARLTLETLQGLAPGQQVTVRVAGREYLGQVQQLGLEPLPGSGEDPRYALDVAFSPDMDAGPLRAGQSARLILP